MTNKRLVWYLKKEKKIDDRQFGFRKQKHNRCKIKNNKILDQFRRKEKTIAIFFNVKKVYKKINRNEAFQQLYNMEIQIRIMELIRELINESEMIHIAEQTDRVGNFKGGSNKCNSLPGGN